jgi:phasin family protein
MGKISTSVRPKHVRWGILKSRQLNRLSPRDVKYKETKMTDRPTPKLENPLQWEMPFPNFTKLLENYKIPGVDFSKLLDRRKSNIEALTKANKIAFEGWQALLRRQAEILQQTMEEVIANAHKQDSATHRMEIAKQGFEKALDHMHELAQMAIKSQTEAFEVIQKRISANVQELERFGKHE